LWHSTPSSQVRIIPDAPKLFIQPNPTALVAIPPRNKSQPSQYRNLVPFLGPFHHRQDLRHTLINHMDRHNLASHQLGSSYFFFPNYESHFPDNGGSPGCASRHEETIPDSPSNDPKFFKPAPFFRFRHPSSPTIESGNRIEADTELILRYLYEATQNSTHEYLPKFHHNRNCQITTGRAIVKPQARSCKM
ncbi:hypothetical protein PSTT_03980, partial [Puccinia striiformis]